MKQITPWYTCDTCERIIGAGKYYPIQQGMGEFEKHFCNHHCHERAGSPPRSFVSADWPSLAARERVKEERVKVALYAQAAREVGAA